MSVLIVDSNSDFVDETSLEVSLLKSDISVLNDEKVNEFINEFDNIELTANPEFNKLELEPFEFDVELHE